MKRDEIIAVYSSILLAGPPKVSDFDSQFAYLRRFLPTEKDARICDAGCGNGCFARLLARSGYSNVVGVDLFEQVETDGLFCYRQGSVDGLPIDDNSVDLLFSFSVIYYLPDPGAALREYVRVSKPGAIVIFSAHSRYSLFTLDRLVARVFGGARHLRDVGFYSATYYERTARRCGMQVVDVDGFDVLYVPSGLPFVRRCVSSATRVVPGLRWLNEPGYGPRWLRRTRSEIAYHCLIAARKPLTSALNA